jgi:hypothetical protein
MALNYDVLPQALSKFIHPVHCSNHFYLGKLQMSVGWKKHYMQFYPKYMQRVIHMAVYRVHHIVIALATVST